MYLGTLYYTFQEAIPSMMIKKIIAAGTKNIKGKYKSTKIEEAKTGHGSPEGKSKLRHRKSEVAWIQEQWLFNLLLPYVDEANKQAGWNFVWDQCEPAQFTQYRKDGYYRWHMDGRSDSGGVYGDTGHDGKPTPLNWRGKVRKLSVTLSLNANYTGGDFEVMTDSYYDEESDGMIRDIKLPDIRKPGSLVVFPAFLHHRVTPIIKGTRHSVVLWCLGPPFV